MISKFSKEIKEKIEELNNLNNSLGFPKLYIVGGAVRNHFLGLSLDKKKDIDFTVNDGIKSNLLGLSFGSINNYNMKFINSSDIKVFLHDTAFDFSSGKFIDEEIIKKIKRKNNLVKESFSRDFTINSILYDIENKEFVDPTNRGISDCINKIIRTILSPKEVFESDPNRIIRAIYFSSKYNMEIHKDIVSYIKKNKDIVKELVEKKRNFIVTNISEAISHNEEKTLENIKNMGLIKDIPMVGNYKNILIKNKLVNEYYGDLVDDAYDPIGGFIGNDYPRFYSEGGGPSSVPITHGDHSTEDDNNRSHGSEYRSLPYLT